MRELDEQDLGPLLRVLGGGAAQALLGCEWGRKVATPDDKELCDGTAAKDIVLHDGGDEMLVRVCATHRDRIYAETNARFMTGDRVYVDDDALARLREIMRNATGEEPPPNHHGTVAENQADGSETILINFDDGACAPYPTVDVHRLVG